MLLAQQTLLTCVALAIIAQLNGQDEDGFQLVPTYITASEIVYEAFSQTANRVKQAPLLKKVKSLFRKTHKPVVENEEQSFSDFLNKVKTVSPHVLPGTLWCGMGDIASNDNELGLFKRTDACCKAHDNCPDRIAAGNSREHILNDGIFTRSSCSCDHEFYQCLKKVSSPLSISIGKTYFNFLRPQCFRFDYLAKKCLRFQRYLTRKAKCLEWTHDETKDKTFQWFETPDF